MPLPTWTDAQVINQLDSGAKWTGATITYAFATSTTGLTANYGEASTFSAFTAAQQAAATIALSLWDDLIAPDLVLTTSTTSNIEFANSFDGSFVDYAAAYFPTGGTVWINNAFSGTGNSGTNTLDNNLVNPVIGRHGFSTYVHEIGHAFGLDHPGNYNGSPASPSNYRDSTVYSIMSYFGPSWGSGGAQGSVAWADWVGSDGVLYEPQTMMIDDILAIQSMYGAETTTRTGNTVYGFSSTLSNVQGGIYDFSQNLNPILCLYDSGGTDTLDVSGWSTQSLINLNAGSFSSCNSMTDNISIAYGVQIENASAGGGNDTLTGNAANNVLSGGAGTDILNGGAGDDTLIGGAGADQLKGEGGSDTASYVGSAAGVTVNLALATAQVSGGDASGDVLTAITNLIGSSNGDTLTGSTAANSLNGGLGDDVLIGAAGADQLIGGGGTDTASYLGSGAGVTVNLALATAQVSGGDASGDVLTAIANLIGSSNSDTLTGNSAANSLNGGLGDDVLIGGAGADQLNGGGGTDTASYAGSAAGVTVSLALATAQVSGGDASGDTLVGILNLIGSAQADTLTGNLSANVLNGGSGNDRLRGGGGNDQLTGGLGDDAFIFNLSDLAAGQSDTIADYTQTAAGAGDSLRLVGVNAANVSVLLSGSNAVLNYGNGTLSNSVSVLAPGPQLIYVSGYSSTANADAGNLSDGYKFVSDAMNEAANAWSKYIQYMDSSARVDYQNTSFDDGTRAFQDMDNAGNQAWVSYTDTLDSSGLLKSRFVNYDDNTLYRTYYDYANNQSWSSYNESFDDQSRLDYRVTTYDDGSLYVVHLDRLNNQVWTQYVETFDSLGRLDYRVTTNDDNSLYVTHNDNDSSKSWSTYIDIYDTQGRNTFQSFNYDNGARTDVTIDAVNAYAWARDVYDYDASNALVQHYQVMDDGSILIL